jgi:hypothetical protein
MNSGIAKQVREKYPWVYAHYKQLCRNFQHRKEDLLGMVQGTYIDENKKILNLYTQLNYGYDGKCYTNYDALKKALEYIPAYYNNKVIAIPYLMGCYRGGGDWNVVYKIIEEIFANSNCEVLICEYNGG